MPEQANAKTCQIDGVVVKPALTWDIAAASITKAKADSRRRTTHR